MKKLLSTIILLSSLTAFAQVQMKDNSPKYKADEFVKEIAKKSQLNLKRAAVETHTYFPFSIDLADPAADDILGFIQESQISATWRTYVNFLYPDSSALLITSTGGKNSINTHLVGNTFDPRDSNVDNNSPTVPRLSRWTKYTVDTLGVRYGYHRHLDSFQGAEVVDTMIFQFFSNTKLTYVKNTASGFESFAYPNTTAMNLTTLLSSGANKTFKLPLRKADRDRDTTTGWVTQFAEVPVDVTISPVNGGNSAFSYTMAFKPMVKANLGDTVFNQQNPKSNFKKNNYVSYSLQINESPSNLQVKQYSFFNNSFNINSNQKYNFSTNGWTPFVPGNAFFSHQYAFAYYKITTANLDIKNSNTEVSLLEAYPNPANANSEVVLSLKSVKNTSALVTITDISGKVIKTMNAELVNGKNNITVSTSAMSNGLYIVTVKGADFTSSSKLVIE